MTQEQKVRTRDEQVGAIANDWIVTGMGRDVAHEWAAQVVKEAEARGAEEERGRKCEVAIAKIDPAIVYEASHLDEEQKKLPEWVHYNPETGERSLGRWPKGVSAPSAPYIRGDLALRPTNVAALEARVQELEAEVKEEQRISNMRAEAVERWTNSCAHQDEIIDRLTRQLQALQPGRVRPVIHSPARFMDDAKSAKKAGDPT